MRTNSIGNYPDFVIKDISASLGDFNQYAGGAVNTPVMFTIDGPMSLKLATQPYTVTVNKVKEQ
jgi:hypothetical protein